MMKSFAVADHRNEARPNGEARKSAETFVAGNRHLQSKLDASDQGKAPRPVRSLTGYPSDV
jgi:hypothetical protein